MASTSLAPPRSGDATWTRPELWLIVGLLLCAWAWLWALTFGETASDLRVVPLALGLVAVGSAAALRLHSPRPGFIADGNEAVRRLALFALVVAFGLAALALTALLGMGFFAYGPFRIASGLVAWLLFAPLAVAAAQQAFDRAARATVDPAAETALVLLGCALAALCGMFALDLGPDLADDWDTLRNFLRVLANVFVVGSALAIVSLRVRRLALSGMILFHFGGICTAALAASPSPWIMNQLWVRVYRPYLEFMYINNAYHFYAPEPGPSRYLWCRVIFTDPDGTEHGLWHMVPQMDARGRHEYAVALAYQRHLAMTEGLANSEPPPPTVETGPNGELVPAKFYVDRLNHTPGALIVGKKQPAFVVPLHPSVPHLQQYQPPAATTKQLLASYARHVAHQFERHPDHPDWKLKGIKLYRTDHMMIPPPFFARGMHPRDPESYRPHYMGMYDARGNLMDPNDPFLYWLLPILRVEANAPYSEIRNYARLHAGDRHWVRPPGPRALDRQDEWIDPQNVGGLPAD